MQYKILYHKAYDIWILETWIDSYERYLHAGLVIYIGGWLPLEEQIEKILDLILLGDDKQKY